jgi:hypothetical protein
MILNNELEPIFYLYVSKSLILITLYYKKAALKLLEMIINKFSNIITCTNGILAFRSHKLLYFSI